MNYAKAMEASLPTEFFARPTLWRGCPGGLGLVRFARHCVGHFTHPNSLQTFAKKSLIVGLKNLPLLLRFSIGVWAGIFLLFFAAAINNAWAWDAPSVHGFVEHAFGARVSQENFTKRDRYDMLEQRLQLKSRYPFDDHGLLSRWSALLNLKGDFVVDEYFNAKTEFDLREGNVALSPGSKFDIKIGRQVLTWGTGDYLFINDMFPKDYVSFYLGRDDEYLKKPSDALRLSLYPGVFNIDCVVIAHFEPNTIADGQRLSFFDSFQGGITGRNSDRALTEPSEQAENFEYAGRLYRNFGSAEAALYVFRGFDKMPRSYKNEAARELYYERQDVFGASLRGPLAGGIANFEGGYAHSPEDARGDNRLVENSSMKLLTGYEKDLGGDLKVGFQYYYEQKLDYAAYRRALLPQDFFWDEYRHLLTQRVTKLFKNQTVMVSFFNFYSPSDRDGYVRLSVGYDFTDHWKCVLGGNFPWGEDDITDFGQMKQDKNIFIRIRYSF